MLRSRWRLHAEQLEALLRGEDIESLAAPADALRRSVSGFRYVEPSQGAPPHPALRLHSAAIGLPPHHAQPDVGATRPRPVQYSFGRAARFRNGQADAGPDSPGPADYASERTKLLLMTRAPAAIFGVLRAAARGGHSARISRQREREGNRLVLDVLRSFQATRGSLPGAPDALWPNALAVGSHSRRSALGDLVGVGAEGGDGDGVQWEEQWVEGPRGGWVGGFRLAVSLPTWPCRCSVCRFSDAPADGRPSQGPCAAPDLSTAPPPRRPTPATTPRSHSKSEPASPPPAPPHRRGWICRPSTSAHAGERCSTAWASGLGIR